MWPLLNGAKLNIFPNRRLCHMIPALLITLGCPAWAIIWPTDAVASSTSRRGGVELECMAPVKLLAFAQRLEQAEQRTLVAVEHQWKPSPHHELILSLSNIGGNWDGELTLIDPDGVSCKMAVGTLGASTHFITLKDGLNDSKALPLSSTQKMAARNWRLSPEQVKRMVTLNDQPNQQITSARQFTQILSSESPFFELLESGITAYVDGQDLVYILANNLTTLTVCKNILSDVLSKDITKRLFSFLKDEDLIELIKCGNLLGGSNNPKR